MLMTALTYVGYALLVPVGIIAAALFAGFLRAFSVRMMFGHWPHQSPEAMETWKNLP